MSITHQIKQLKTAHARSIDRKKFDSEKNYGPGRSYSDSSKSVHGMRDYGDDVRKVAQALSTNITIDV